MAAHQSAAQSDSIPPAIVVTGLGLVTPVGVGRQQTWNSLLAGKSGLTEVRSFNTANHSAHLGGEVSLEISPNFKVLKGTVGRATRLALSAAREALADAGFNAEQPTGDQLSSERFGIAMGTTSGEPGLVEEFDDRWLAGKLAQVGKEFITHYPCHVIAAHLGEELDAGGPNVMLPAACAAGNYALGYAFDALRHRRADVMLAGGADAFSRITYSGFARLGAIATDRCQPFDLQRQGMVPGEGAAVLVLERFEDARRRGARIYCEVAGYGLSCDAHHMTAAHPEGNGAAKAMRQALEQASLTPEDVDYVSAHGTGTPTNDRLETRAFQQVFGPRASQIPISSIKSMIGHTMGAASAIESCICSLAITHGRVPPTINYHQPDPECELDCVPNVARDMSVNVAMNNAYAFGGNNASVLFKRVIT